MKAQIQMPYSVSWFGRDDQVIVKNRSQLRFSTRDMLGEHISCDMVPMLASDAAYRYQLYIIS